MSSLKRDLVLLVLRFLDEEKFKESVHKLEQESRIFFNLKYFEEKAMIGEWDELDKYLSSFTNVEDNEQSMRIFFEIRKQKYLQALDRKDRTKALEILTTDLHFCATYNKKLYKEITQLITLDNVRENEQLSKCVEIWELRLMIEENPLLKEKLSLPAFNASRLQTLIDQSMQWQHLKCKNPQTIPEIETLLTDHICSSQSGTPTPVTRPVAAGDREKVMSGPIRHEVTYPTPSQPVASINDLPRFVARTMQQGSVVISMDFHPFNHTFLTVGCSNGEVTLWEVGTRVKVVTEPFKIWNMATCSVILQGSFVKDPSISVSRVSWSPDGKMIGVAFTRHLIHLFAYQKSDSCQHLESDFCQHLEIDAHVGCVNDLAFGHSKEKLCVVSCGDDKFVKVWDLSGEKLYTFEGHDAPVYSICSHQKENMLFILSTALDGKLKGWQYDNKRCRVQCDAPGQCCTMLYSDDGSRLFFCGTSKDGKPFLAEWDQRKGATKRRYMGLRKISAGVVQFDTTHNRFLAVGDENQVKFWDMDKANLVTTAKADGGLPSLPRLRFNKRGNLLAVTTAADGFKILANADGLRTLKGIEASMKKEVDAMSRTRNLETVEKSKPSEVMEIVDPTQCRQVTITDCKDSVKKVARILYKNSGDGILALGTNGVQRLWKWSTSEQNPNVKVTTSFAPQHWQPKSGLLMTNDVPDNSERNIPCIALSKNDSYVISACGGKVILTNMWTFKVMATLREAPPASTFLSFHPQDSNIIGVGMEDSSIDIYTTNSDVVLKARLKGHRKHITGLAFSHALKLMVSAGADGQLCFWSVDSWEKKGSLAIQLPDATSTGEIRIQFHTNQLHLLVYHETEIVIYDCKKMDQKWMAQVEALSSPITSACYSCDNLLVYASFADGNIRVFDCEYLRLLCRIAPSAYIPQQPTSQPIVPMAIAAHPQEQTQIAVGLSDGSFKVLETPQILRRSGVADKAGAGAEKKIGRGGRRRRP